MEQCIEKLIKFDSSSAQYPSNNANTANDDDDDADVVIETDEIQLSNADAQIESTIDESDGAKTNCGQSTPLVQPSTSFSSFLKQNFATTSTNQPNNQHFSGSPQIKQRRLMPASIEKHPDLPEIIKDIERNFRVMIVMRGAPGSGKSYLAKSLIDATMNGDYANHIFSTDDYFYDKRSKRYLYDRSKLSQAHDSNQFRVAQRTLNGWSPIIVDNTNMKLWEMFPYIREAVRNSYVIKLLEPNTPWRISVGKLEQRNKHGVDREAIARMLTNYEPGTIMDVLKAMHIDNYRMIPHLRNNPEIIQKSYTTSVDAGGDQNERSTRFTPRDQRPRPKFENNNNNKENNKFNYCSKQPVESTHANAASEAWQPFEEEQTSFWNSKADAIVKPDINLPKPQRKPQGNNNIQHMYSLLQDGTKSKVGEEAQSKQKHQSALPSAKSWQKHQKNCPNENKSFQQIRQIYPIIPIALLWDLFEKCDGDGDWTMDILLNENETKEIKKLTTQEQIDRDNFVCMCASSSSSTMPSANLFPSTIPIEWRDNNNRNQALPARSQRQKRNDRVQPSENDVLKQIEEQFVISDEHYSEHMRKIRDSRRNATSSQQQQPSNATLTIENGPSTLASSAHKASNDDDINIAEDNEMIEMDLGIELICQLDQKFGTNALHADNLKDIKTTVFMPKSLGQQLYATWVESLIHQIEEQRQQSVKDDEEFAREFQEKQSGPQLFENAVQQPAGNTNLKNIADMEYVWRAYNTEPNDWKQTTPEDLATKLTKAKLFEIFPNVDRQTLVEVFEAHGNKFAQTVEFFKESLKNDIGEQLQVKGQELLNQAYNESKAVSLKFKNFSYFSKMKNLN